MSYELSDYQVHRFDLQGGNLDALSTKKAYLIRAATHNL